MVVVDLLFLVEGRGCDEDDCVDLVRGGCGEFDVCLFLIGLLLSLKCGLLLDCIVFFMVNEIFDEIF